MKIHALSINALSDNLIFPMNDVENEVEEQQAEDGLVNRVPELKQLSENIDKATNTFINAALELESAIQQYQRAESKLGGTVTTISKKVDTINQESQGKQFRQMQI